MYDVSPGICLFFGAVIGALLGVGTASVCIGIAGGIFSFFHFSFFIFGLLDQISEKSKPAD